MLTEFKCEELQWRRTLGPRSEPALEGPCVIENYQGKQLAMLSGFRSDEQERYAALFAAAPYLAEALEELLEVQHATKQGFEARQKARKALALLNTSTKGPNP